MKFVTAAKDGKVKIWQGLNLRCEQTFDVSNYYVMCIAFMTRSKKLACASADRMITFYDLTQVKQNQSAIPHSRIENLLGVPHCMDYYEEPEKIGDNKKNGEDGDE